MRTASPLPSQRQRGRLRLALLLLAAATAIVLGYRAFHRPTGPSPDSAGQSDDSTGTRRAATLRSEVPTAERLVRRAGAAHVQGPRRASPRTDRGSSETTGHPQPSDTSAVVEAEPQIGDDHELRISAPHDGAVPGRPPDSNDAAVEHVRRLRAHLSSALAAETRDEAWAPQAEREFLRVLQAEGLGRPQLDQLRCAGTFCGCTLTFETVGEQQEFLPRYLETELSRDMGEFAILSESASDMEVELYAAKRGETLPAGP